MPSENLLSIEPLVKVFYQLKTLWWSPFDKWLSEGLLCIGNLSACKKPLISPGGSLLKVLYRRSSDMVQPLEMISIENVLMIM